MGFTGPIGLPGGLGQPSGSPGRNASLPLSGGQFDPSAFLPGFGNPGIQNRIFVDYTNVLATSGSITIPASTPGNLIVVLVAAIEEPSEPFSLSIGSNVDLFTKAPFYLLPNDGFTANQMFTYTDGTTVSSMCQLDCWYAVSAGGTSQINWLCPSTGFGGGNYLKGQFWIFEVAGISPGSHWELVDCKVSGNLSSQPQPYLGPVLSFNAGAAYFTLITTAGGLNFGSAVVGGPWTLDAGGVGSNATCMTYVFDQSTTGPKQVSVTASFDPNDGYQALGVAFGPVLDTGGTTADDVNQFLPNVWILT